MDQERPDFQIEDPDIKRLLLGLADRLKVFMPDGWGFSLFLVQTGVKGSTFYISSLNREDFVRELESFIVRNHTASTGKATDGGDERRN
jgi:hypothetical protein